MKDVHSLILWANANNETKHEQVQKIYEILSALIAFGEPFCPNYLPTKRKAEAKSFILSCENIELLLKKRKKDEELDERLGIGKSIGFFSSLIDDKASTTRISIGNSNARLTNTIVINFPIDFDFTNPNISDRLAELFKGLVRIFKPYWGCISGWHNSQQFGGYYDNNKGLPNAVFWMNYWNEDIGKALNLKRRKEGIDSLYTIETCLNGFFLRLQKEPIDINNKDEISFQKEINDVFKL